MATASRFTRFAGTTPELRISFLALRMVCAIAWRVFGDPTFPPLALYWFFPVGLLMVYPGSWQARAARTFAMLSRGVSSGAVSRQRAGWRKRSQVVAAVVSGG